MGPTDERQQVTRAAGVVGLATLASRVGGFLRDLVIAYFFGAGPAADAFFVAFRIPNLLRRLFAEGSLTIAFIPVFTEVLHKRGREEAFLLARTTGGLLSIILLVVCVAGVLGAAPLVRVMAPGFEPGTQVYDLAVTLTAWCFPYIFFISLVAMAAGVLNSLGHFFAPAAAPALLNLAIIATAVGLAPRVDPPVLSLAYGVVIGGVAQVLLQVPYLRAKGLTLLPAWRIHDPALKRILKLMIPAAFGAAVYQVAVFMNTLLASLLPTGSVSFLYYADRLIQFPLGIFAIAVSTAILPSLSRQAAAGDRPALLETMRFGIRLTLFITVPAMVGLIVLAQPLVVLLFMRGEFGAVTAAETAGAVLGYGAGLWAFAGLRSVVQAFYALKDTKTPVYVAAVCLVINLAASLALMGPWGHSGLALATSIAGMANFSGLLWLLRKRLGPLGGRSLAKGAGIILALSLIMGLASALVAYLPDWGPVREMPARVVRPLASLVVGLVVYLGAARLCRLPELDQLLAVLRRR